MGCITASVKLLNEHISASVKCLNEEITARVVDLTQRLSVKCGIVCSLADVQYLEVSPQEVQWITPDELIMYTVTSNVEWEIQ